eukprot:CAMPEP_0115865290 /NCGR_PEP_ID=MMETSP0287-20121206/19645_1 /TAXON_ID=412157 /ORGANISM="Chrysochromulina rotalis, Strain UIO044" /LENGTH=217 /DNA_ID=CAMNT_0003319797 /DNA_START=24 /DNA_END=677 /DNA_ORIENTATION=+
MGQACSRGNDTSVLPVSADAPASDPAPAAAPAKDVGSSSHGKGEFEGEKTLVQPLTSALMGATNSADMITITLQRGNGSSLELLCQSGQNIQDLHVQISNTLGAKNCPIYSIRLIFKAKVLSHYNESTLGSFGVVDGDTLNLIVVKDGAAQRFHGDPDETQSTGGGGGGPESSTRKHTRRRSSITGMASRFTGAPSSIAPPPAISATAPAPAPAPAS